MSHSPLDQFKVREIVDIELLGYDISITNSSLFMMIAPPNKQPIARKK